MDPRGWTILLPVKRLSRAKTRLRGHTPTPTDALALAFAGDTAAATIATTQVDRVVAITVDPRVRAALEPLGVDCVGEGGGGGLNAAIGHAAGALGDRRLGVLTADLPALKPSELDDALARAASHPRAFVPDAETLGTVLLTTQDASTLEPQFGKDSAASHETLGAVRLPGAWPGLRRDVDTVADLEAARKIGLGCRTAALVSGHIAPRVERM
ncbi:MAG TPA: 2-phospho-L-lactate guanylyltransferase [Stackebrandtia sp.]|uniref:2-phospho-L-lactate guanylyltransferase n=1 Tax=Stackebrandtia sp. TaxID=2023065 RepID=UPI002D34DC7C|nr:2-phospho-L-lactate guanylyltransferase [Stackebrandtia sp.]HZE40200.1 2-phospho-L-lactate guanylyltransferase [Stackebrandtia sp.]